MSAATTHARAGLRSGDFVAALRAEWTKFRTVRGWVIGIALTAALLVLFAYLTANGMHSGTCTSGPGGSPVCGSGHPFVPTGPGGEAVADSYYLVGGTLSGDGTLTARLTGLSGVTASGPANAAPSMQQTQPGLAGWSKAGIIVTAGTRPGAEYAAVLATPGHGIRFQYDYSYDTAGLAGATSARTPRWLRLTRSGNTLSAYDSRDGRRWLRIGAVRLRRLPGSARIGLFVTSPETLAGRATMATGVFDHVTLSDGRQTRAWHGQAVGERQTSFYSTLGSGSFRRAGGGLVISGSGDIAPAVTADGDTPASFLLQPLVVALLVIVVLAALCATTEYRRGLIRTTFAAIPNRTTALLAKAVVIGGAAFVAGAAAAAIAIPLGDHLMTANGNYMLPSDAATDARVILGVGVLLALSAVAALALGTIIRTTAGTVTTAIIVFVLPVVLAVPNVQAGSSSTASWLESLLRIGPAAGLAMLGALPRSAVVSYRYTLGNGYFPLAPGLGLTVLAAWALVLTLVAAALLRRRDA
ncbi:MAG TPA: hypothetical protein VG293_01715 [Solirubrobacteraceae bacterium]|nr:hypothetical protein [Solirubrobacteraceae bacterium]